MNLNTEKTKNKRLTIVEKLFDNQEELDTMYFDYFLGKSPIKEKLNNGDFIKDFFEKRQKKYLLRQEIIDYAVSSFTEQFVNNKPIKMQTAQMLIFLELFKDILNDNTKTDFDMKRTRRKFPVEAATMDKHDHATSLLDKYFSELKTDIIFQGIEFYKNNFKFESIKITDFGGNAVLKMDISTTNLLEVLQHIHVSMLKEDPENFKFNGAKSLGIKINQHLKVNAGKVKWKIMQYKKNEKYNILEMVLSEAEIQIFRDLNRF